jgi:hypothetical protein
MNHSTNIVSTSTRQLGLLIIVIMCFLVQACKSDQKETTPEVNIENKSNIVAQTSESYDEIIAQEKAWAEALVANDMNTVATIMHRDFRLIRAYRDAPPISKEMYLGMKGMSALSAEVTSLNISEEMDSIVVARITMTLDWEQEGVGKLPPHFDMIDIWKQNDVGMWQILSRISQTVEESAAENKNTDE